MIARLLAVVASLAGLLPLSSCAHESFIGRPVYSEPAYGLQMPPGCRVEPAWRDRLANSDLEVWVVDCHGTARAWLLRRSVLELLDGKLARLRYQILDDRALPGETVGDSATVQCSGRGPQAGGYVVFGARWRAAGSELRLAGATGALRADPATLKFAPAALAQIDCTRFPAREAMLKRLQQATRGEPDAR
ncbi:MAG: hypothetical protein RMK97_00035 [Sutterellaceae bacterium]|nr:hypothetical protein [Burkholderiaceae bacterium]MCX7901840.1 hypothetical protein [Burkholderiaceae bacterium]MDW8428891.1 hypothetical protein [Sutterellaceae bacterium]